MNRALFLDRDGILIEDCGYPHRLDDLRILEPNLPSLVEAQKEGFLLIVVTNQSGIGKGLFTFEDYNVFEDELHRRLFALGVKITDSYCCPDDDGRESSASADQGACRKPRPGMILRAARDHDIDLQQSYMIGDRDSDRIELAELRSFILRGSYPLSNRRDVYDSMDDIWEIIRTRMV